MSQQELISKKELLQETNISYGQLYRWKRENLIPESWFMKQSSYTGQETFFPRDKILKRIASIQEMKDSYSLNELSKMLSPEKGDRAYSLVELIAFDEIDEEIAHQVAKTLEKEEFDYIELLYMIVFTRCINDGYVTKEEAFVLIINIIKKIIQNRGTSGGILLMQVDGTPYMMLSDLMQEPHVQNNKDYTISLTIDNRIEVKHIYPLDVISNEFKAKYHTQLFEQGGEDES